MTRSSTYSLIIVALLGAANLPLVEANPNHQDSGIALAAHGSGTAKEMHAAAAPIYSTIAKETQTYLAAVAENRGARLSGKAIGQTRLKLIQMGRIGTQLEHYQEPAGFDFRLRALYVNEALWNKVIAPYAAAPTSQNFVESIRLAVQKQTPARMKILERIQKLVVEQKWRAAEDELNKLFDGLEPGICFLSDGERLEIHKPFSEVRSAIETAMRRLRSEEAAQSLGKSRAEQLPDFANHLVAIREATAAIAATGQGNWNGEQVTAPQLVQKLAVLWSEVHVECLRCRGLDWAMQPLLQLAGANAANISPDPTSEKLQQDYSQFSKLIIETVNTLIRADTQRVSGEDTPRVYVEYVDAIAPLARQVVDQQAVKGWEESLQQLADKSPNFGAEVKAYDAATRELLRWRARTATNLAQARSAAFPTLDKHLYDATVSKTPFLGLFPERPDGQLAPRLLAASPAIMTVATPRLMGKPATAFDVVRVSPSNSSGIARYRARTYATIPAGLDLSEHVSALKADLLIGDSGPALTLATATAVQSAERGDLAAVGGSITGHHLEGIITRFAVLPSAASVLTPLGALPVEDLKEQLLPQMLMRFDLKPDWVQHENFFVQLPTGSAE